MKPPTASFPAAAGRTSRKKWSYGDGERPLHLESILDDRGTQVGSPGDVLKSGPTLLLLSHNVSSVFLIS